MRLLSPTYRRRHDNLVKLKAESVVTSAFGGEWQMRVYADIIEGAEHIALVKGDVTTDEPVLVRMHALDASRDLLGLGGETRTRTLQNAMKSIDEAGRGVVVLLRDLHKSLEDSTPDGQHTLRRYGLGAQILTSLGVHNITLLTNSPRPRVVGLEGYGLEIRGTHPIEEKV